MIHNISGSVGTFGTRILEWLYDLLIDNVKGYLKISVSILTALIFMTH